MSYRRGYPAVSGNAAQKRERKFESANKVLASALKQFGLENDFARYKFILHWREIVGEQIASRTRPECLTRQILVVRVRDSAWAQELVFQKEIILGRLRKFLGEDAPVNDIHFYVGPIAL
ncbi:MAG: DUF721 domain-containing protein [Deltaproteobacteria bacterium]|nr:DUF721 domain-containing protein [Deltaproteobacteria bacterium]